MRSLESGARSLGRICIFLRKISVVRAGGFLVFEPNFHLGRGKVRWASVLFLFGLTAALAFLSACGSTTTTVGPTITVSCTPADVTVLGTSQCTATVENESSTLVNWSISPAGTGSITAGGLYTAPSTVPTNNVVTVTATSQVASTLTATQNLTLQQATAISAVTCLDPSTNLSSSTVSSGDQLTCSATTSTGTTVPVNWSVANTNNPSVTSSLTNGRISAQGIYTAPLIPPPGQKITITATSQALSTETMSVTVTVVFGNAVLSGQYVFSTTGRTTAKAFWARVGNFSAGSGSLTGIEDTNQGGSSNKVTTQRTFSGSYSVGPDGRGTMQFCENSSPTCPLGSASATSFFRIVVISPQQVHLIEFSSPTAPSPGSTSITAGGEMILQDPTVYSARNQSLSGTYSFNFNGVSSSGTEESVVGEFMSDGFGNVSAGSQVAPFVPGEIDINANGPVPVPGTTYSINTNGRGTMTLNGFTFSIYPINAGRAKFIEIDAPAPPATTSILAGEAYIQQSSLNCGWSSNALSGLTVLETTGNSSGVVVQDVASFSASNGAVSSVSMDQNSSGIYTQPVGTGADNYAMDPCGRGTLSVAGHSYVYYIISTSNAVVQEVTSGVVAYGFLLPSQGGPFADATLTGSYAFRLGGTDASGSAGNREDFDGQLTSSGLGTGLTGTSDLNDFGATQTGIGIANGMYIASGGIRGTMALPFASTPATTRNLVFYMVNPKLFYVLDVDQAPAGTSLGVINIQF